MNKKLQKLKDIYDEEGKLTVKDVAAFIGLSSVRLYAIRDEDNVPPYYLIGNKIYYDYEKLLKWLEEQKNKSFTGIKLK
jgi:hypothetical protein